jgi:hypothetical protein
MDSNFKAGGSPVRSRTPRLGSDRHLPGAVLRAARSLSVSRLRRPVLRGIAVLGSYVAVAVLYFGRFAIDSPAGGTIGTGPDVQIFIWGLRWWPFALEHGLNPLVSRAVWAPFGSDVLWTTTVPALSLLAAPVTQAFGPQVAWNILCVLAPAFSAWAAYVLCRELIGRFWPSMVGGLLFGFSSYQLAEGLAHLHVTATLLVPLGAFVAVRYVRGRLSGIGLAVRIGMIAAAQFLISPELLATMVLMGVISALVAMAVMAEHREALRCALWWGVTGLAGAGVVVAPLLVRMLRDIPKGLMNSPSTYSTDLVNLVVPTRVTALGGSWALPITARFSGDLAEQCAYLGVPLLLVLASFTIANRANPAARLLALLLTTAILLSLGPQLRIAGHGTIWLPTALFSHLPVLADALPARFAVYAALFAAVIVSMWLATAVKWSLRWLAVGLVVVSLAPAPASALWWKPTPPSILHDDLGRLVPPGSTVISLPFWSLDDRGLFAQAVDGMRFRLVDRWMQVIPTRERTLADSPLLTGGPIGATDVRSFESSVCAVGIEYAVVWNHAPGRSLELAALHLRPVHADDLLLYRLPRCSSTRYRAP